MGGVKLGQSRTRFALDSAAFLHAADLPPAQCIVPTAVMQEFDEGGTSWRRLQNYLAAGAQVQDPGDPSRERVHAAAERAGSLGRLSQADIDVIALALEAGACLVTDDYTALDVAKRLGVTSQTIATRGIEATMDWESRCRGCGRRFPAGAASKPCSICGSEVRLSPRRS